LSAILACSPAALAGALSADSVIHMSLEELMNIEVTTASKKPQALGETAAAVFVITQEHIRRSGATSVPEALRLVPGVHVARIGAASWAISIRGFLGEAANKLLVLVDGRSVYSPLFSGVFWSQQDVMLEDVERIEVVRGPGGALWGANAVNGVINIITKAAGASQGTLASVGAGTADKAIAAFRYGGRLGEDSHYRIYGKFGLSENETTTLGQPGKAQWTRARSGFRVDSRLNADQDLTVQGDAIDVRQTTDNTISSPTPPFAQVQRSVGAAQGINLLGRYRTRKGDTENSLQAYLDYTHFDLGFDAVETRTNADVEFQQRRPLWEGHDLMWGLGLRVSSDRLEGDTRLRLVPGSRTTTLISAFVNDEIALIPDRLRLTLGSKFEHNDYTGFEVQPNARLWWRAADNHSLWLSASRAVRTPSRIESDGSVVLGAMPPGSAANPGPVPVVLQALAGEGFKSERVVALEAGWRAQLGSTLSLDLALFHNRYQGLRNIVAQPPQFLGPLVVQPFISENGPPARAVGAEVVIDWLPTTWWRSQLTASALNIKVLGAGGDLPDTSGAAAEDASPKRQYGWRNSFDLGNNIALDLGLRRVTEIRRLSIPAYTELHVRLAWKPRPSVELSLVGQNLLHRRHSEFNSEFFGTSPREFERAVFGQVRLWY
jgi:iron complex outermembrane receptor protein